MLHMGFYFTCSIFFYTAVKVSFQSETKSAILTAKKTPTHFYAFVAEKEVMLPTSQDPEGSDSFHWVRFRG